MMARPKQRRPKELDPRLEAGVAVVRELAERVIEPRGLEIVDVALEGSLKRPRICVYLDGPTGVMLDDCAEVSRSVSRLLEELEEDPFPGAYALEVSSPGLDRPFDGEADYRRNVGRPVDLHLREARPGGAEKFTGVLTSFDTEGLDLELEGGVTERFSFEEIRKVHRSLELKASP